MGCEGLCGHRPTAKCIKMLAGCKFVGRESLLCGVNVDTLRE